VAAGPSDVSHSGGEAQAETSKGCENEKPSMLTGWSLAVEPPVVKANECRPSAGVGGGVGGGWCRL
jgi:hypothetical protein